METTHTVEKIPEFLRTGPVLFRKLNRVWPRWSAHGTAWLVAFWLYARLASPADSAWWARWGVLGMAAAFAWMLDGRLREDARRSRCPALVWWALSGAAALLWLIWGGADWAGVTFMLAGAATGFVLRRELPKAAARAGGMRGEAVRWLAMALAMMWLIFPYAQRGLVGAGDAQHYALQLHDSVLQARDGVWPFWVGQSEVSFCGDVHPLRTAPYFQHVGLALDFLSGGGLTPVALYNLVLVLSFAGLGVMSYFGLSRLVRRSAWMGWGLSVLVVSSPGILGGLYSGDMVATWMTLPWLVVVFYVLARVWLGRVDARGGVALGLALGILWWGHPPIAFCSTLLCALGLLVWVLSGRGWWERLWWALGVGGVMMAVAAYVLVSVFGLDVPPLDTVHAFFKDSASLLWILRESWSGWMRPVEEKGTYLLQLLQISPATWVLWAGVLAAGAWRARAALGLSAMAFGLFFLMLPWPGVVDKIWARMPELLTGVTDIWLMQRFYPIMAVMVPLAIGLGVASGRWRCRNFFTLLCLCAAVFGLGEAAKFHGRAKSVTASEAVSAARMRPESALWSRYSYEYFGLLPRTFSLGTSSPWMSHRLLEVDSMKVIGGNLDVVRRSPPEAQEGVSVHRFVPTDFGGEFSPNVILRPGAIYVAWFSFDGPAPKGLLEFSGPNFFRHYYLPLSGERESFGATPGASRGLTLWTTTEAAGESVAVRFHQWEGEREKNLGKFVLREIKLDELPVRLRSLVPYRAEVETPKGCWLETPKLFVPGYRALVNGDPAEVARSPDGLVMVPVPEGKSRVELAYSVGWWLPLSWALSVLAIGAACWVWVRPPARLEDFYMWINWASGVAGCVAAAVLGWQALAQEKVPQGAVREIDSLDMEVRLPAKRLPGWERIWTSEPQGLEAFVQYVDEENVRFVLAQSGRVLVRSEEGPTRYRGAQRLRLRVTAAEQEAGTTRVTIRWNEQMVLRANLRRETAAAWAIVKVDQGEAASDAALGKTRDFSGRVLRRTTLEEKAIDDVKRRMRQ